MKAAKDLLPGVPLIHSPFFQDVLVESDWDAETRRVAVDLNRDGFAVIDFPEPELEALAADIVASVHADLAWDRWRSGELAELPRATDAWAHNESVRRIAANAKIVELLGRLYGRPAFPFQTLNFAIGSQQDIHVDLVHFASSPENYMCGVWLALEDIAEGAGPLRYYPGSHRWPAVFNEHVGRRPTSDGDPYADLGAFEAVWERLAQVHGAQEVRFHPRKGQALIWAAGLHHGGAPHTDRTRTRFSQVTHYFFDGCAYFTPLYSNTYAGRIGFRHEITDVRTGQVRKMDVNGQPVPWSLIKATAPPPPNPPSLPRRILRRLTGR
ncbi:phytanoyl-CoA dioxygenase family protein [Phenylobacterium terrae]|uniref:Phytanoyl-CoA dioxygenase family protein n=1 Tax=Phenylobacterium terrae TaxID=2665495 RepID=A0ABW4N2S2_9CAUL